jgi:hypothetical protein
MRIRAALPLAILLAVAWGGAAAAQQAHPEPARRPNPMAGPEKVGSVTATLSGVGKLETRVERLPQSLGVILSMARGPGQDLECSGMCYFANSSAGTAWKCGPGKSCRLYCTVSPPVGGCD